MTTVTSVSLCGPVWPFSPGDRLRIAKLRIPRARRLPMAVQTRPTTRQGAETVFVDRFCDGIIGPSTEMLGPVRDGGHIVANTAPGCWGPMITPAIRGGHEVTVPVAVEGADVGDAIAIRIKEIKVTSLATASGTDRPMEGRFEGDPFVATVCPQCRTPNPKTILQGIGPTAVRC